MTVAALSSVPVHITREGDVAFIAIDHPPVNVLSRAVREGLWAALDSVEAAGVERVVLTGSGKTFVAGADANEFSAPPQPPHLPDIVQRIERFPVPIVAAINGAALGGGLELALACRLRLAAPEATLGLPEVTLGVVPGAGGTQRLPRLIGLKPALSLISLGRVVSAVEAQRLGLVDACVRDVIAAARRHPIPDRLATGDLPAPAYDRQAVESSRQQAARRSPGQSAPLRAIELVEAACRLPLAEGLSLERQTFLTLKTSDQAAALRHVFFAERAALAQAKRDGQEIGSAVVVGGGTMGAAIAYALAGAGIRVALVETDAAAIERARTNISKLYVDALSRGKLSAEAADAEQAERFSFHAGYDALPRAELAIEAVFEDLETKRRVFAALDAALPQSAILATNTSYLDVNRIADELRDPSRFLGLHFFSPAHVMKLLEVIRGQQTSAETLATALRLAGRLKKIPVLAGVCDGFIGNRVLTRYRQICDIMLIEGALPWRVDAALRGFGMAMGPYEVQDLSGLDIAYANRERLGWRTLPGFRYIPIADRIVEETGRLGRKTNAGWYDYAADGAKPSPLIEALVLDASQRAGIARRAFSDEEIVERASTAMIEEGMRILEEGIAASTSDIDVVMIHGYGFPRWRGGPMHYASRVGWAEILQRIERFAHEDPRSFCAPVLLRRAVEQGLRPDDVKGQP